MTRASAIAAVESYYRAFHAADVAQALAAIFDENVVLDSPVVRAKFGAEIKGQKTAILAASAVAATLKNVTVESTYANEDGTGVAALIHFPLPGGPLYQSEHFDVDATTGKITRLRSFYDPRKLLSPGA